MEKLQRLEPSKRREAWIRRAQKILIHDPEFWLLKQVTMKGSAENRENGGEISCYSPRS